MTTQHNIIPINVDRNVSFRDYRDIEGTHLKLVGHSPLFYTFQGEGPIAGHPVVFARTAGCNIGAKEDCPWCDTKFFINDGKDWELNNLFGAIREMGNGKTKTIVLTGGEPLLQKTSVENFGDMVYDAGWQIQLESNGYFVDSDTLLGHTIVVSPKIPHNKDTYLPRKQAWVDRGVHLKYVVSADPTSKYHDLPQDVLDEVKAIRLKGGDVYVSAMCEYLRNPNPGEVPNIWDETLVNRSATAENYLHAATLALKYGIRVSYQTHLFGAKE
jgi:organic radical activating enzyme